MNDIEYLFYQDSFEKKRIGSNVTKRASRKGFIRGGIKTQYDFMSSKERKKLNGEVRVSYMYNTIESVPSFNEIQGMEFNQAKNVMGMVKHNFTNKELTTHWEVSVGKMYGAFEKYGIHTPKSRDENKEPRKKRKSAVVPVMDEVALTKESIQEEDKSYTELKEMVLKLQNLIESENEKTKEKVNGFRIEFSGEYSKEDIENRLLSLSGVLIDNKKYEVNITLTEVE